MSVLIRIGSGVLAAKILAVFIGPAGMALIGNFRNLLNTVDTFSTMGFQTGIIKYVAENEKNQSRLYTIISTVFIGIFCLSLVLSAGTFLLSDFLSDNIFNNNTGFAWVFKVLAFTLPWHAANIIFMAVVNGLGKFKQIIAINIAGNLLGLSISIMLIWQLKLTGALLGLIISPALLFIFSFYLIYKQFKGLPFLSIKNFDFNVIRRLLSYSLMSLVNAVLSQIIFISIRNKIVAEAGVNEAGFWEAMNRIAFFYLMFITTLLSVYFLPKLSIAKNDKETKEVYVDYYKTILPLFIAGCAVIYVLRALIVKILFTEEFLPMENLFLWQLMGDIFKVASLILGTQFLAKKMTTAFIMTEVMSFTVLYFSSMFLISIFNSEGAVMAHAFTYALYMIVLVTYFRKKLF